MPLFLHPTDAVFQDMLVDDYDGALFLSLGRVIEVSVAAMRLVFSGIMERHPNLKVVMSHTGGALPYQSGRMDKNGKAAKLPQPPERLHQAHVHRHGVAAHGGHEVRHRVLRRRPRHVRHRLPVLGCPRRRSNTSRASGSTQADTQKIMYDNARRILNLKDPVKIAAAAE